MNSMTKRDVADALFRALSVYSFIESLNNISFNFPTIYGVVNSKLDAIVFVRVIAPATLLLLASIVLWFIAPLLASFISKQVTPASEGDVEFSSEGMQMIIFSSIGLYLIVNALPELSKILVINYGIDQYSTKYEIEIGTRYSYIISAVIQIVLGLWLFLGSRGIEKFVRMMRRD